MDQDSEADFLNEPSTSTIKDNQKLYIKIIKLKIIKNYTSYSSNCPKNLLEKSFSLKIFTFSHERFNTLIENFYLITTDSYLKV